MRLSYALLIAAAFVSSGNAVATTDSRTTELSAMASPNAVASIDTAVGGEKRSLRYHDIKELEDESDDKALLEKENAADEEERKAGANMFSTAKLDDMVNGNKLFKRFSRWAKAGYNPYNLPDAVKTTKYDKLRKKFYMHVYHRNPQ